MAISDNYPRFVFRAPPGGQPPEGSAAAPTPVPTEKSKYGPLLTMAQKIEAEKKEEALKAQRKDLAKTVLTEDVAKKTDALDKHFRENIDETGDAKEYIETFTKDKIRYDQLVGNLKLIMSRAGTDSAANFENWEGMPPTDVAKIFDIENQAGSGADYIPRGKGRLAFVAGLKQSTPDSDPTHKNTYEQSDDVVKALVQILHERFEKENRADADLNQEKNKPLLGHTLGDMKKELLRNLQGGSGLDKTMIVGSLALVAWLGYKYRDSDIFFGVKLKDVASIGGGVFLLNYLSGKVSPDGRTVANRLTDIGLRSGDFKTLEMQNYARLQGMDKNEKKVEAFQKLKRKPVSKLYEEYEKAANQAIATGLKKDKKDHLRQRWLNVEALGFKDYEVDGEAAFDLVEDLVKKTALNQGVAAFTEENPDLDPENMDDEQLQGVKKWSSPKFMRDAFKDKYLNGTTTTFFQAVMNEYPLNDKAEIATKEWNDSMLYSKAKRGLQKGYEYLKDGVKTVYQTGIKYGKEVYYFTRREVVGPAARWIQHGDYSPYPWMKKQVLDAVALLNEQKLKGVLPTQWHPEATDPDHAKILGYPGIPFESKTTSDGRDVVEINGIEFDPAKGIAGNAARQAELKRSIEAQSLPKIQQYLATAGLTFLKYEWDTLDGAWKVRGVSVEANPALHMNTKKDDFTLNFETQDQIKLYARGKEITDFGELNKEYTVGIVQSAIWEKAIKEDKDGLGKFIPGLPLQIDKLGENPTYGFQIEGTIGGLKFTAVGKGPGASLTNGLQFVDLATGNRGGFEKLALTPDKGSTEFLEKIRSQLYQQPYFSEPFVLLEAQMENTTEGFMQRLNNLFAEKKLWVIPTDISGAVNGKIAKRHWKFMLENKMRETSDFFLDKVNTGSASVADIGKEYLKPDGVISRTHKESATLARYIQSFTEEGKADHFDEFLKGQDMSPGKTPDLTIPTGLENLNYRNQKYIEITNTFKEMITDSTRYNYPGFESLDVSALGLNDSPHEIINVFLRVWSHHTRRFANAPGNKLSENDEKFMYHVLYDIHRQMEIAMDESTVPPITIFDKNLPAHVTEDDLEKWVSPMATPPDTAEDEFIKQLKKGRETDARYPKQKPPEEKEEIESDKPVVLGKYSGHGNTLEEKFPEGAEIIKKLNQIENEEFVQKKSGKSPSKMVGWMETINAQPIYEAMAHDMKEAVLYRAVVQNWTEKELTKEYRRQMQRIYTICYDEGIAGDAMNEIERLFRYSIRDRRMGQPGVNPTIADSPIAPSEREKLIQAMQQRDAKNINREDTESALWKRLWNKSNSSFRGHMEEDILPFYHEYSADQAIVEHASDPEAVVDAYEEDLDENVIEKFVD